MADADAQYAYQIINTAFKAAMTVIDRSDLQARCSLLVAATIMTAWSSVSGESIDDVTSQVARIAKEMLAEATAAGDA